MMPLELVDDSEVMLLLDGWGGAFAEVACIKRFVCSCMNREYVVIF